MSDRFQHKHTIWIISYTVIDFCICIFSCALSTGLTWMSLCCLIQKLVMQYVNIKVTHVW